MKTMNRLEHNKKKYGRLPDGIYVDEELLLTEDTSLFPKILNSTLSTLHHTLILCTKGELNTLVNSNKIHVQKNDFIVLCQGQSTHLLSYSKDFKAKMIILSTGFGEHLRQKDYLPIYLRVLRNPIIHLQPSEKTIIENCYILFEDMMRLEYNTERKQIAVHILQMLFYVVSQFEDFSMENNQQKLRDQQLFESFMQLYKQDFSKSHEVSYYAGKLCITPNYLSKISQRLTGKSAKKWINETLMDQACIMLRSLSGPSIKEISELLGFPNPAFFSRYFKTYTGLSPKEFRESKGTPPFLPPPINIY